MKKTLFDADFRYNEDGNAVAEVATEAIGGVMEKYVRRGFSPREIAAILHQIVVEAECDAVLKGKA